MSIWLELSATIFTLIPIFLALFADKYFSKKITSVFASLVFPSTYVIFDWLIGKAAFGTFSSIAITQLEFKPLLQLASITGMEGIAFIVLWFSSTMATLWLSNFDFKKEIKMVRITGITIISILLLGGIYFTTTIPTEKTVKIAGVTVQHHFNYYDIVDINTPRKIVFWSEIAGVIYEENEESFLEKAKTIAKENEIYFIPAVLKYHYNSEYAENKMIVINPSGNIEFEYEKTISWYPTKSDGIIKTIDTPYGRIGGAICFDADFPKLLKQAAEKNVDILLNPKFDTQKISPGHTFSGLMRSVEGGYSMFSQVNDGVSIATDYRGNILSYQDHFTTENKIMIADIPIKGRETFYSIFGDWFIYINIMFLLFLIFNRVKIKRNYNQIDN